MQLFEPYRLPQCGLELPNRLAMAPMTTYSSHPDGTVSDEEIAYLQRRAAGGVGTIITAACYVLRAGKGFVGQWSCDDDRYLPSLRRAAEAIRGEGAVALLQIHDAGRMANPRVTDEPRAPSAVRADRPWAVLPRPMSALEIEEAIEAFAAAARRALQAGFDGVEIHGANTYLLQQFFSPHSNRRDDEWGGDLQRRMRFPLAVVRAVREATGPRAVVGYRLSPEERETPGITFVDTQLLLDALADLPLDYLHTSQGDYTAPSLRNPDDKRRRVPLIAARLAGRAPLMAAGSIKRPTDAQQVLEDGAHLVALGRPLLYEPEWALKVRREEPLRECLPPRGGASELTLPPPLYEKLLSTPGWVPLCDE